TSQPSVSKQTQARLIAPWTVAVQLFFPFHHVSLAPVFLDERGDAVAAFAGALGAFDAEHVEFSFDVTEDEIGPPRHGALPPRFHPVCEVLAVSWRRAARG